MTEDISQKIPAIRLVAMPKDANGAGDIFGGWIMSQVDIAAGVVAHQYAGTRVATVAVNSFQFKQPVLIGDLISCYAEVVKVGTTSLTVDVEVYAERRRVEGPFKVTEATLTFVAIDDNRQPIPVRREGGDNKD